MRWLCKVTNVSGQKRITLPKKFISLHKFDKVDYFIIDDRDPDNIKIGGLFYGDKEKGPDKAD